MEARELWDAVKHEVRDLLAPNAATRAIARRDETSIPLIEITAAPTVDTTETVLVIASTSTALSETTEPALTPTTTAARPTATPKPAEDVPAEMSVAAKAGIVIGALGGILIIFVVLYLVFSARRKKLERQRQQLEDDEKINGPFADSAAIPATPAKAPRLSLRPVTQFLPNFTTQSQADRRASRGIALTLNPVSHNTNNNHNNNTLSPQPPCRRQRLGASHPQPSTLTRKTSIRKDLPKPLDLTMTPKPPSPLYAVPPSPAGTEYSMHSMAAGQSPGPSKSGEAIAAAGGPAQSTVHRVQLDFRPTLRDEMELRAGGLVRLLHEYDDGWALCIRLDRSQQGVVPEHVSRPAPSSPGPNQASNSGAHGGSGNVPPLPVPKDKGYGYGRPRSPGGGGGGTSPAPGQAY
ncbi:hypothetical protein N0V88_006911 [Collariella sp. IMI 366227]|nr:hypothetical protein N0V88_006911 [Collariella sp. IMI 366227]